jgi:SAM-dependent methyltransferase
MEYKKEWFNDESFWEEYAPIIFDDKHWREVPGVADGVIRLSRPDLYRVDLCGEINKVPREGIPGNPLAPSEPSTLRLLDLCCGMGRISLELAGRGFAVTGVDITESYLKTAEEDAARAKLDIEFIREDARSFKRPGFFDTAVNLYISFGYFEDPRDDALVVRNVYESLKPGGSFIIETLGKEIAVRDFVEAEWFERAGFMVLTEYAPADSWAGLKNRWILINNERRIEKTFTQRLYAASELRTLLEQAGFSQVELYGDWNESPYDNRAAGLIAVGRK